MFLGEGERIELVHRATDRAIFARGALRAARWVVTASHPASTTCSTCSGLRGMTPRWGSAPIRTLLLILVPALGCAHAHDAGADARQAVIETNLAQLQDCWDELAPEHPGVAGSMLFSVDLRRNGSVEWVDIAVDELGIPKLGACTIKRIKRWRFPEDRRRRSNQLRRRLRGPMPRLLFAPPAASPRSPSTEIRAPFQGATRRVRTNGQPIEGAKRPTRRRSRREHGKVASRLWGSKGASSLGSKGASKPPVGV